MDKSQIENELWKVFSDSIILPNTLPLADWCKQNVYLPNPPYSISGYLDVSKSPYLLGPLQALDDDNVREIIIIGNPRGGKTLLAEAYLLYTLMENPADCWFAVHKADSIKSVMDTRLLPLLEANDRRIEFTDDRFQKTQRFIKFKVGSLKLVGAQNAKSMVQTAGRVLIGDEVHEWAEGVLDQFRRRSDDFPHSKKILIISQAGDENKDLHKSFNAGHQAEFGFKCPKCEAVQEYVFSHKFNDGGFGGLNWDRAAKVNGVWNVEKAASTAHYTCTNDKCRANFYDTPRERRLLNDNGQYIVKNPEANIAVRSFRWNALATPNISYADMCRQYLNADYQCHRGKYKDIENFWKQSMSRFWQVSNAQDTFQPIVGTIDVEETGSISNGVRVMAVDSQAGGSHPYIAASFNTDKKELQILAYGKASTWDEIEKIQIDNRVKHNRVLVDCRFQQLDNIYLECFKRRKLIKIPAAGGKIIETYSQWLGTYGIGTRKNDSWLHGKDRVSGADIYKPYSPFMKKLIKFGTAQYIKGGMVQVVSFADTPLKDALKLFLDNNHPDWKLILSEATKNDKTFMEELNSEKKVCLTDKMTGQPKWIWQKGNSDNDFFDCMKLIVLAGQIMGII